MTQEFLQNCSIRPEVLNIQKYVAGKPISEVKRELGLEEVIKLASNENPLGCSPKAKEVIKRVIEEASLYPDSSSYELKKAIAKKLKVKEGQIFCGAGSDSLIKVICQTILNPEDESIMGEVTFSRYEDNTKLMGAKVVKVPLKDNFLDIEAMVERITPKTKVIWFCNPNNPTGGMFTGTELSKVLHKIPKNVYIIMDEAYYEYVTDEDYPDSLKLLPEYPNMIILRTFSKAYGLASLRCGYGICHEELVQYLNRVINPFDVNLFAQYAAIAALEDEEYLKLVHDTNKAQKEYLCKEFDDMKLNYVPSNTNFIMVDVKGQDKFLFDYLLKKGIIIRPGFLLGVPGWLRVSIGTEYQNKRFIEELKQGMKAI